MRINVRRRISPNVADVAFTSISSYGTEGYLNKYVRNELGYTDDLPKESMLQSGVVKKSLPNKIPIIYIVTTGTGRTPLNNLIENLSTAFREFGGDLHDKVVWIPLMGTGAGGLNLETSFSSTLRVISTIPKENLPKEIFISVPDEVNSKLLEEFQNSADTLSFDFLRNDDIEYEERHPIDIDRALRGRKIWLAGHNWGEEDKLSDFIKNSVWEKGKEKGDENAINSTRKGDIVLLKSAFQQGGQSILRIKAVGVVFFNPGDGQLLVINWSPLGDFVDFPGLGKFRRAYQQLTNENIYEVIEGLLNFHPYFFGTIADLENEQKRRIVDKIDQLMASKENYSEEELIDDSNEESEINDTSQSPVEFVYADAIATDHGDKDSLNFTKDVQAMAALIALKEMKPPLAIALFGKWGSGKSFFMNAIEKNVRQLSKYQGFLVERTKLTGDVPPPEGELFYRGIAHIKFNAWSYMDSNLWAGLAHSLFEKLDLYIHDNTKSDIERLKVQVKIAKRLEVLHSDLENYEGKLKQLESLKEQLEKERDNQLLKWFKPKYDDKIKTFLKYNGLNEEDIEGYLPSQLRKYVDKGVNFLTYLKGNSYEVTIWLLSIVAIVWALKGFVIPLFDQVNLWPVFKSIWSYVTLSVVPILITGWNFVSKHKKLISSLGILVSEEIKLKEGEIQSEDLNEVQKNINSTTNLILQVKDSIAEELANKSSITEQAIQNFIAELPGNENYTKHLGIITTIRKDFETLSELFADRDKEVSDILNQKEGERVNELNKDRRELKEAFEGEGNQKLDRIVLYIDDLDRCTDEKVLEVLQAVHLLMAFPLFIVLVGVDERCVHNALTYEQLKRYRNIDKTLVTEKIKGIEPREYLEKIFQIPFQLPHASEKDVNQLIDDIVPDMEEVLNTITLDSRELTSFERTDNLSLLSEGEMSKRSIVEEIISDYTKTDNFEQGKRVEEANEIENEDYETVSPEAIRITPDEKKYLQLFSPLVGNNPRTIKRYINIFRIVKTHEQGSVQTREDMIRVIFVLAMFIGEKRDLATKIFKEKHGKSIISIANDLDKSLVGFIDEIRANDQALQKVVFENPDTCDGALEFIERFSYKMTISEHLV